MFDLDDSASRLLGRLARVAEVFRDIVLTMQVQPDVRHAFSAMDVRSYPNGTVVELFAEAEFSADIALVWWLDVWWRGGQWIAEAQVLRTEAGGQVAVREYDAVTAVSFEQLEPGVEQLAQALKETASDPTALLAAATV